MTFWNDFADGFEKPFKWAYGKLDKADKLVDKAADGAGNLVDLLGGNANILLYVGIGVLAVVVLPVVLEKIL